MTLLEQLIAYSVSQHVLSGDGIDAFRDLMPESPDNCVSFYEYSSDPPSPYIDAVHRSVQITARGATATLAKAKADALFNIFNTAADSRRLELGGNAWCQVYARQLPFKLDQDSSDRVTYCFNLGITTNNVK